MTDAQKATLLLMLENNLELILEYMDETAKEQKEAELLTYINAALVFIEREGITINLSDIGDCMLVTMYAGWLYDRRKDPTAEKPRMLRYNLNNRLFSEKVNQ